MNVDKLIEAIQANIKKDRERLTDLYTEIKAVAEASDNDLGSVVLSEHMVKIADSLTKQTAQLVDLAKLKQKVTSDKAPARDLESEGLEDVEIEALYSEIEAEK